MRVRKRKRGSESDEEMCANVLEHARNKYCGFFLEIQDTLFWEVGEKLSPTAPLLEISPPVELALNHNRTHVIQLIRVL